MGVELTLDQTAVVEAIEDVRKGRALVAEAALELAHGLRPSPVELREDVRLCLGDTHVSCHSLDVNRDEVDSAFEFCDHSHMGYYDMDMTDDELIRSFEAGSIRAADFPHEAHIRVTRLLIDLYGRDF